MILGLGGTIAMAPGTGAGGGVVPALPAEALVGGVPELAKLDVDVRVEDFRIGSSASLTLDDLHELAGVIKERIDEGADGVVVTQGTDTIEETAYLLDLVHAGPEPVVVTGAMRNPTQAGPDGPANVLAAVQVAVSPEPRELGALVVMADEIHAARSVSKTDATSLTTFRSPDTGPLGRVVEGQPRLLTRPAQRYVVPWPPQAAKDPSSHPGARVGLITAALGDDGALLADATDRWDALVVAAFGAGHVPERWLQPLAGLAQEMPVVLSSRTGAGPTLTSTYGFPGSESSLVAAGLISSGFLGPFKARILLHVLLASGADQHEIAAAVGAAGGHRPPADWPFPPTA